MMVTIKLLKYFLLMTLLGFSQLTVAKNKSDVTLEEASEYIRIQSKGKVLSAKTTYFNNDRQHRIQVLTPSGRVKVFQVPASRNSNKNGGQLTKDRRKEKNNYYQKNSTRNNGSVRYTTPKNNINKQNLKKGESKQK